MDSICERIRREIPVEDVIREFGGDLDKNLRMKCPFHDDHHPSFSVDKKRNKWHCFVCKEDGSSIDYVMKILGLSESEAIKEIMRRFNMNNEKDYSKVVAPSGTVTAKESTVSVPKMDTEKVKAYLKKCSSNVGKTDYFRRRGLNDETVEAFCLGYDEARKSVTIPYSRELTYYMTRCVEEKRFYKMPTGEDGEPIFNGDRIKSGTDDLLFVVESPICAMSIEQYGWHAVACSGISWKKVADEIISNKYKGGVVICFDNDDAGKKATDEMNKYLMGSKIEHIAVNIANEYKDPNEMLLANEMVFKANLRGANYDYEEKYHKRKKVHGFSYLMGREVPETTWIVKDLLPAGTSLLVGKPKIGKSWMVLELCAAVASGTPFLGRETVESEVLYYALEDTESRLQRRIQKIQPNYAKMVKNFHYAFESDGINSGLDKQIEREIIAHPGIKLIIIDTLAVVRDGDGRRNVYDGDYKDTRVVKKVADKYDVCILFVHHDRKAVDMVDPLNNVNGSNGLVGSTDSTLLINVMTRQSNKMSMTVAGRDVGNQLFPITFDKDTCKWSADDVSEETHGDDDYVNSPYVNTIKHLVNSSTQQKWCGTSTDLRNKVFELTGREMNDSAVMVGRIIKMYQPRLAKDGIFLTDKKGKERMHLFYRAMPMV